MITATMNIFAEYVEPEALTQFYSAMEQPFVVKGALMPDAHSGYSLPIGAVVMTDRVVVPAWVGYDIGCGMLAVKTGFDVDDVRGNASEIYNRILDTIPVGFKHNSSPSVWGRHERMIESTTSTMKAIFAKDGLYQLGSLGGGNHFIEIGEDENSEVWVVIHSGSRGIGHAVATHYMKIAGGTGKAREGHFGLADNSAEGAGYLGDMQFCLEFALRNRVEMMQRVLSAISSQVRARLFMKELINRTHNHIEGVDGKWVHRKGATHANIGMMGVIPGNMRDGSFIVRGKGNSDSLRSSSHGAGRVMGRKEAKRTLEVEKFTETMAGVVANVGADTLDESPFAYKDIFSVMKQQEDLVDVVHHVKPIINVKG